MTRSKVVILLIKRPIFGGLSTEWAKRNICVSPVGTEFTKQLLVNDKNDLTLFEQELAERSIEYQRIRVATPRHNGKVERQNGIDSERFFSKFRMYSLEDGQKQLAVYQRKSNNYWKTCLGMRSPNQVPAFFDAEHGNDRKK